MIDYDATLKMFFEDVMEYLEKIQSDEKEDSQKYRITDAVAKLVRVADNPMNYADYVARLNEGMETADFVNAFFPTKTQDNKVYLAYFAVVNSMGDLNSEFEDARKEAQQKLLAARRTVKYKLSTNWLKDITFALKSPKSFAIKSTKQHQI